MQDPGVHISFMNGIMVYKSPTPGEELPILPAGRSSVSAGGSEYSVQPDSPCAIGHDLDP